jgi:hypothetical protein
MAVEAGQRAWDEQGEVWNRGLFPLILDVCAELRANGVPIRPGPPCAVPPRSAAPARGHPCLADQQIADSYGRALQAHVATEKVTSSPTGALSTVSREIHSPL